MTVGHLSGYPFSLGDVIVLVLQKSHGVCVVVKHWAVTEDPDSYCEWYLLAVQGGNRSTLAFCKERSLIALYFVCLYKLYLILVSEWRMNKLKGSHGTYSVKIPGMC